MNIYDEVTKLPRQHRLVLCQFILRTISPSYDEKIKLLGRVPRIDRKGITAQDILVRTDKQRAAQARHGISKDAIA